MRVAIILKLLSVVAPFAFARSWTTQDECPTHIKTTVSDDPCEYGGRECNDKPEFRNMDSIHTALSNCPSIETLDLRVTGLGCSEWPSRWDFPFNPSGGETYPNLTSLRLEGYNFGNHPITIPPQESNMDTLLRWWQNLMATYPVESQRTDQNVSSMDILSHWSQNIIAMIQPQNAFKRTSAVPPKTNLDLWLSAMDFSHLKDLKLHPRIISSEVLHKLPPRLTSLERLGTTNTSFITALPKNSLTHLTYVGAARYHHDLKNILAHHGPSLQSLEFRKPEQESAPFIPTFSHSLLNPKDMPKLQHIAIDVPRNGTHWPFPTLSKIASLPTLESADIYMNIASPCMQQRPQRWERAHWNEGWTEICQGEERFQQPYVTEKGGLEVFKYMRENKVGHELKNLTIFLGDWERGWDGPLSEPGWLEGKRAKVTCGLEGGSKGEGGEKEVCKFEAGSSCWDEWDEGCRSELSDEYWKDETRYWDHYW
jgi:hypothetical protein